MSFAGWRQWGASIAVVILCVASVRAIRWVWRDITYWSRSVTVPYKTASLEECVRATLPAWPDVTASFTGPAIALSVPSQEGLLVKEAAEPHVARIVVYGHSSSISHLGPDSEESVQNLLRQLANAMSEQCSG